LFKVTDTVFFRATDTDFVSTENILWLATQKLLPHQKKSMHGELVRARKNTFLTSDSLSPTYLFNSSGP